MDNEKWRRILELAHAAADLPREDRSRFLRASSTEDDVVERALELADEFDAEPDSPALHPGSHIEHFIVETEIGRGGMGCVYSARDTDLERTVALKILRREAVGSTPANSLVREARAASALNHPNIVTVYEVIRDGATVILVMEYVSGQSIRDMILDRPPLARILRIAQQVAAALNAAHEAGIVHRDIKPENVIAREDGHVKVLDFGLARSFRQSEVTSMSGHHSLAGTLRYMPPERCTGSPATPAGDIFAFGLVLYELSTGQHPFAGESPVDTMHAILHQQPAPPSVQNGSLPPAFDSLVLSMLAQSPEERPTAAQVMLAAQGMELGHHPSPPSLRKETSSQRRPSRRGLVRGRWLSVFAVLLVLAGAIAAWKWTTRPPRVVRSTKFTNQTPENRLTAAAVSADGRFTAYATSEGIVLRDSSAENQQLSAPDGFVIDHLAWYANGTALAVSGFSDTSQQPSVWRVSIASGKPQLLRDGARYATPSPDGKRLAFISGDYSQIWVSDSSGEHASLLTETRAPDAFPSIWWSSTGTHLIAQRKNFSGKDRGPVTLDRYYERTLQSISVESGKVVFESPDLWIESAVMLKDGRLRFLRYDAPGSYYARSLWEVRSDPDTGAFHGQPINLGNPVPVYGAYAASLSSTDDGRRMVVIRSSDEDSVYVADLSLSPPRLANHRRLTLNTSRNFPHAWTADSQSVIYEASPAASWDLFLQPLSKRFPIKLTTNSSGAEVLPQLTPDGKAVLYASAPVNDTGQLSSVMRIPVMGGASVPVPIGESFGEFRCSISPNGRCVIRKAIAHEAFVFYALDPVKGIGPELARTAWQPAIVGDWDISPDGTRVAFPNHDSKSAVIRVIHLNATAAPSQKQEVVLSGLSDLFGVVWAASGHDWFVSLGTTVGRRTVLAGHDGRVSPLGNFQGSVPSPDGKKLAYVDHITASDAWDIEVQ